MKAHVDKQKCLGCGICIDVCPDVFETDDEGLAQVKVAVVPAEAESSCREAAEQCPEQAIDVQA